MNNITERAATVLREIDAALALAEAQTDGPWICVGYDVKQPNGRQVAYVGPHHTPPDQYPLSCKREDERNGERIAASRTGWPTALRCLKTAIEGLLEVITATAGNSSWAPSKGQRQACDALAILCEQWEASRP